MKSLLLLFTSLLLNTVVVAQIDSLCTKKTIPYKWELSAAINSVEAQMGQPLYDSWYWAYTNIYGYFGDRTDKSFSVSIVPKYSISDNIKLRLEAGITNINIQSNFNGISDSGTTSNNTLIKNDTILQKIYRLIPGVQWHLISTKYIEGYCGLSLSYLNYSEAQWWDNLQNNQTGQSERYVGTAKGGYAIGVGGFSGFNIHLHKTISIGAELASSFQYYKLGGTFIGTHEYSWTTPKQFSITNSSATGTQFSKIMYSFHINFRL
ncbi:MAG: hypothetical protein Q8L90_12550 [Bacteroidota bacterium]|nr:hypothetical protein [Bacteroidota bacterium]